MTRASVLLCGAKNTFASSPVPATTRMISIIEVSSRTRSVHPSRWSTSYTATRARYCSSWAPMHHARSQEAARYGQGDQQGGEQAEKDCRAGRMPRKPLWGAPPPGALGEYSRLQGLV